MKLISSKKKSKTTEEVGENEGCYALIFGAILAIVLFIPVLFVSCAPPESKENHDYVNPKTLQENNVSAIEVVVRQHPSPACSVGCEADTDNQEDSARSISNEFYKNKRDLNAQEGVWRASNVTAFYAFVMSLLTAIGLYLLAKTWRATQLTMNFAHETLEQSVLATKAANRTTDAAVNAEKANLFMTFKVKLTGKKETGDTKKDKALAKYRTYKVQPILKNFGKTPATDVTVTIAQGAKTLGSNKFSIDYDGKVFRECKGIVVGPSGKHSFETYNLEHIGWEKTVKSEYRGRTGIGFYYQISFKDIHGIQWDTEGDAYVSYSAAWDELGDGRFSDTDLPEIFRTITGVNCVTTRRPKKGDEWEQELPKMLGWSKT